MGTLSGAYDVFDKMLRNREENQDIDFERNQLVGEYFQSKEWKPKSLTCSKYVRQG